ncbi:hypothetical protein C1H46_001614 [Malus baccata]|uniref:Uncharacterized protein n=1 Tax=Malus baccata TaxID=106549 RepID=A0A540NNZ6_MALBA|nr:hypothetical protein C1H46_001614 [Malus baccata]
MQKSLIRKLLLFQSDLIRYACYPFSSFQEIHKYTSSHLCSSSENPVSILLINWGCYWDLKKLINLSPKARVFVVDSHCPIHLHDLSDQNDRVVVLYTLDDERPADLAYDIKDLSALANMGDLNSYDEFDPESDKR